jgi:DnaK suppressor protein
MPAKKSAARSRKARKPPTTQAKTARKRTTRKTPTKAGRPATVRRRAKPKATTRPKGSTRPKTVAKTRAAASKTSAKPARRAPAKARKAPVRKAPAVKTAARKTPAKTARKAPVARKPAAAAGPAAPKAGPAARRAVTGRPTRAIAVPSQSRRPETVVAEEDEGYEGYPRHSLLLGPRNVKPYIERRGEAYMGKEQLDHFRSILTSWKRDLMEEVDRTMTHMKDEAANPPDPNDRATLESEFALELRTRDRERKLIRKIEEALKRIDDGSYGYCLETGEPIGVKRLEARPVATLCIEAQERRERRERQYGDRDDWYR